MGYEEEQYQITVKEAIHDLASEDFFTIDTNRLIFLAKFSNEELLERIANSSYFILTNINVTEIRGLIFGKRIGTKEAALLNEFIARAIHNNRLSKKDTAELEKILAPLGVLLPRQLVHNVMISLPESYINALIELYTAAMQKIRAGKFSSIDERYVREASKAERDKIETKCKDRFVFLCSQLKIDINRIDTAAYFQTIKAFINSLLEEIEQTQKNVKNFDTLIVALNQIAKKTYKADVRFVADTLANGARGRSSDPDVISLFEIHAARIVA